MSKLLDPQFALFNCHINQAQVKANIIFKLRFGEDEFKTQIQPFLDEGTMSIFNKPPNKHTIYYVDMIWFLVNEIPIKKEFVTQGVE